MKVLVFDTETTGLPVHKAPLTASCQPDIVQFAAGLFDLESEELLVMINDIFQFQKQTFVPDEAANVHGITTERVLAEGVPANLDVFLELIQQADIITAFNINFDITLLEILLRYLNLPNWHELTRGKLCTCTMQASTDIVQLPPTERMLARGMTNFKPPKLTEAYETLFREKFEGAHDAFADVTATFRVFKFLRNLGVT